MTRLAGHGQCPSGDPELKTRYTFLERCQGFTRSSRVTAEGLGYKQGQPSSLVWRFLGKVEHNPEKLWEDQNGYGGG